MSLFKVKDGEKIKTLSVEDQMKKDAIKHGVSFQELKKLAEGKKCPKYGIKEPLHIRKVRGGKLVVFNISEKHRGEKISISRKNLSKVKDDPIEKLKE